MFKNVFEQNKTQRSNSLFSESPESIPVFGLCLRKIKETFLIFGLEFKLELELELELGLKFEWLEGVSKTLGGLLYFCTVLIQGAKPPTTTMQNAQACPEFLTLPRVVPTSIPIPI